MYVDMVDFVGSGSGSSLYFENCLSFYCRLCFVLRFGWINFEQFMG